MSPIQYQSLAIAQIMSITSYYYFMAYHQILELAKIRILNYPQSLPINFQFFHKHCYFLFQLVLLRELLQQGSH